MSAPPKTRKLIEKLLRRAADPAEPKEAESAREEADRLMVKHGLTVDDFEETAIEMVGEPSPSKQSLARVVAISRHCAAIVSNKGQLAFRGKRRAVDNAKRVYASLVLDVSLHCEIGPRDPGRDLWRICYWNGFIDAVTERFRDNAVQVPQSVVEVTPAEIATRQEENTKDRTPDPVQAVMTEMRRAARGFAQYFDPVDIERARLHLCNSAFEAGYMLGYNVSIEDNSSVAAPNRTLPKAGGQ